MLGRRSRLDTTRAEHEAEPARRMLKFERKLREQMERLATQLHDTQRELNLTPGSAMVNGCGRLGRITPSPLPNAFSRGSGADDGSAG